ncbi:MAG: TIGR01244 family sulfur transferase [Castellaniella sp.]|uniref:TIGR01244 family sulfur transferase n=1 Tax=Castellaniella sp. TaxID=1955812 RepID=UPI002A36E733|nr:TIGR01244 family sulfur transferase [Castellaniella sp.]MDY0308377.1 TIGR01244 family sulfur transferase [Castellaniella sp.]
MALTHQTLTYQTLTPDFAVAPQLGPDDMQALADAGFKSVIINRPDGEAGPDQPRSDDVLRAAQAVGLQARYQPVVSGAITLADVAEFAALLRILPKPVLAYCRSGARCTNLFLAAREHGADQIQG